VKRFLPFDPDQPLLLPPDLCDALPPAHPAEATKRGKRLPLKRQASVEPVFGTTKVARSLQQSLHRGLEEDRHLFRFDMAVHIDMKITLQLQRALETAATPRKGQHHVGARVRAAVVTA